jgi:hypothetical protein
MKAIVLFSLFSCIHLGSSSQNVILYDNASYAGESKSLGIGTHQLTDFNDRATSIKVPTGMVAMIYEHSINGEGYGTLVDLLEDRPNLSDFNLDNNVSLVVVFAATKDNMEWVRTATVNGQMVPGHWRRRRASGSLPNSVAVVGYRQPPASTAPSVLAVNGPNTTITSLGVQAVEGKLLWEMARREQMGVIGNDFRGIEEIGSACFQRESHTTGVPNYLNFWFPQKQKNDHRNVVYFKRTLAGKARETRQVNIPGTFQDYDVNVDIVPNPKYQYLITDGHPREYTDLMRRQYDLTRAGNYVHLLEQSGLPNCDDPETIREFERVEAEIAEEYWPQGNTPFREAKLVELTRTRVGKEMCVYGVWMYDAGHCCHPEIHPAEQLWWSEPQTNGKLYNLNVLCDASRRYWWRDQMDNGTKLKPWGAPPIKGLFAIAFEYELPRVEASISQPTLRFEVANIKHHNVIEYPNADRTYNLVYNGKNIVSFIPHNNAFKVSFEHVGTVPNEPNKIRGFLVIETSVGKVTQLTNEVLIVTPGQPAARLTLPDNSTPEQAPQIAERKFFKKEEGHYYFTIRETKVNTVLPTTDGRTQ